MADELTTKELMALAVCCGYAIPDDTRDKTEMHGRWIWVEHVGNTSGGLMWNPHIDANQRDELAAKLLSDGWEVIQSTCPGDEWPYECELNKDQETQARLGVAKTPGLALCRPTLEMLKAKEKG